MRRTILVAALTLAAPAVGIAAAGDQHHSQVARTPGLTATFSYVESGGELPHRYTDGRVTIVRADGRRFAFSLRPLRPGYDVAPIFAGPDGKAIHIRHLDDKRGDPEVVVDLYWGGAHCCTIGLVYSFDGAGYRIAEHNFGDPGFRLADLGDDGRTEFLTADDRFAYRYTAYAFSVLPVRVLAWDGSRLSDETAAYPDRIRADLRRTWRLLRTARRHDIEPRGAAAAWAANRYRLGKRRGTLQALRRLARAGRLDGYAPRDPLKFVSALDRFLLRSGYAA